MPMATHRKQEQQRRHESRARHVEALNAVVDRDRDRLRFAGNAAADHQHDAEFAQRVRERQHHRGQEARPRERQLDPPQALRIGEAAARSGMAEVVGNRLERTLQRLDREGQIEDDRCDQEPVEREDQRMADGGFVPAPDRRAAAHCDQQVIAEHRRRQHERQREHRLDEGLARKLARGKEAPDEYSCGHEDRHGQRGELEREQECGGVHADQSPGAVKP